MRSRRQLGTTARIGLATLALFALSPIVASGSVSSTALLSMLPFAAALAVAAQAQTLVVQQAGLDLSVPGVISLGALLICQFGGEDAVHLLLVTVGTLIAGGVVGTLSGVLVTWIRITPLVATIGVNALVLGGIQWVSRGFPSRAPRTLSSALLHSTLGLPLIVWLAVVVVLVLHGVGTQTTMGRRFIATGASERAARAAGLPVSRTKVVAYAGSGALSAATGILLAGLLSAPPLSVGDAYLLPSVTAVVLGGTALTGGRASPVGVAFGALFISQLNQLVLTRGGSTAIQYCIEALIIAVGAVLQLRLQRVKRSQSERQVEQLEPAV
jgi:ribose transport system permease protein